uniref:Transposase n=1 Tax=Ascaris lumbricoides TaxID=6252 RepID=A0A0M3I1R6_ASCLU
MTIPLLIRTGRLINRRTVGIARWSPKGNGRRSIVMLDHILRRRARKWHMRLSLFDPQAYQFAHLTCTMLEWILLVEFIERLS